MQFDLLVLGDTPDAWAAAEEAARLGRRTAVLRPDVDGRGTASGIAAVIAAFGDETCDEPPPDASDPRGLWNKSVGRHERRIASLGRDLGVRNWRGPVRLTGPNAAEVFVDGVGILVEAELLLVAVGTTERRPRGLSFDRQTLIVPEQVQSLAAAPGHVVVLGGSRTARAFAGLCLTAGSAVTQIDAPAENAPARACRPRIGNVLDLQRDGEGVSLRLSDGETIAADAVLFAADRVGATASLGLATAGLEPDETGRLWCDDGGRTWVRSILAAGEVVGFPRGLRYDVDAARRMIAGHFGGASIGRLDRPEVRSVPIPHSLRRALKDETFSTPSIRPLLRVYDG